MLAAAVQAKRSSESDDLPCKYLWLRRRAAVGCSCGAALLNRRQMQGWYDYRLSDKLRDEALAAYKDIKAVLRAQRDLVKVTRVLRPVLNYKRS
jgi:RNA-splicing ligase RtcB